MHPLDVEALLAQPLFQLRAEGGGGVDDLESGHIHLGGKMAFRNDIAGAGEPGEVILQNGVFHKSPFALHHIQQPVVHQKLHCFPNSDQADAKFLG